MEENTMLVTNEEETKAYMVNCNHCGAALRVKAGASVYQCPSCRKMFSLCVPEREEEPVEETPAVEETVEEVVETTETPVEETQETAEEAVEEEVAATEEKECWCKKLCDKIKGIFKK